MDSTLTIADPKFVTLSAWARDLHTLSFADRDNYELHEVQGYMPSGLSLGRGDETTFTVDVETGTIVGWNKEKFLETYRKLRGVDEDE